MTEATKFVLAFCGGVVTLAAFVGVIWWLVKPRVVDWFEATLVKPVRETHHQVTVNHHSSDEPTVLDRLADVESAVQGMTDANEETGRTMASLQTNMTALTLVLDEHLRRRDG